MLARRLPLALAAFSIFALSFILFLSGWILQQQSLQALNEALLLTEPSNSALSEHENTVIGNLIRQGGGYVSASTIGRLLGSKQQDSEACQQQSNAAKKAEYAEEKEVAYAVLAQKREDVCHALVMFRKMREQFGVRSDLVLVLPEEWAVETDAGEKEEGRALKRDEKETRRLVRLAQRERVTLEVAGKVLPGKFRHEQPLSPLNVLHLTQYKRILLLNPTSILRQSPRPFLSALAKLPFTLAYPTLPTNQPNPHILILSPSKPLLQKLSELPSSESHKTPLEALSSLSTHSTLHLPTHPSFLPTAALANSTLLSSYVGSEEASELGPMRLAQSTMLLSFLDDEGRETKPWIARKGGRRGGTGEGVLRGLKQEFAEGRRDVCGWDWEFES